MYELQPCSFIMNPLVLEEEHKHGCGLTEIMMKFPWSIKKCTMNKI